MIVWLPDAIEGAQAQLSRVHFDQAKYGTVTASSCAANGVIEAVKDGRRPDSSADSTIEAWISSMAIGILLRNISPMLTESRKIVSTRSTQQPS